MQPPTLIFLHLPKTAGTTLVDIIERQYAARDSFHVVAGQVIESLQRLAAMPEERRAALNVVYGHMPYGVHRLLPGPCAYVTILRETVDRVVSSYYYALRTKRHNQYRLLNDNKITLADYARGVDIDGRRIGAPRNNLTMRLCNSDPFTGNVWTDRLPRTPEMLEAAIRNLDTFAVVGLTEDFARSVALIASRFGWSGVKIESRNVSRGRPALAELDASVVETIREQNAFDVALYDHAKALYESQIAEWTPTPIPAAGPAPAGAGWRQRIARRLRA